MTKSNKLLKEALVLPVKEKSELIEQLIKSLLVPKGRDVAIAPPDPDIDDLWKKEVENRIDAYNKGELSSISIQEAVEKYKK